MTQIVKTKSYTAQRITHDLSVEGLHTHHALAGDAPVLVHNCGGAEAGHSTKRQCASGARPRTPRSPFGMRGKPSAVQHLGEIRDELLDASSAMPSTPTCGLVDLS